VTRIKERKEKLLYIRTTLLYRKEYKYFTTILVPHSETGTL
jgi:hypothetical protein